MGCCSSIPSNDEGDTGLNTTGGTTTTTTTAAANNNHRQTQTQTQTQQQQQQPSPIQMNKPEVTITRASSSLHSQSNIEKSSLKEVDNNSSVTTSNAAAAAAAAAAASPTTTTTTWPIYVRLSNNGQDITFQVPTQPPYLTVSGLRQELLPHLEKNARVKLIYLGRILPDQHVIVPTQTDADAPLPPPKNRAIQIQKEGVIQAMVTKS